MGEYRETYNRLFKGANENFSGEKINKEKSELFASIVSRAEEFTRQPSMRGRTATGKIIEKNAITWIDLPAPVMISDANCRQILSCMIADADDFTVSPIKNAAGRVNITRFSFGVRNVMSE